MEISVRTEAIGDARHPAVERSIEESEQGCITSSTTMNPTSVKQLRFDANIEDVLLASIEEYAIFTSGNESR